MGCDIWSKYIVLYLIQSLLAGGSVLEHLGVKVPTKTKVFVWRKMHRNTLPSSCNYNSVLVQTPDMLDFSGNRCTNR